MYVHCPCLLQVVYIIDKKHSRACAGHLRALRDNSNTKALFAPVDHRLPRLLVAASQCPPDFFTRPSDYASTLFVARIGEWLPKGNMANGYVPFAQWPVAKTFGYKL